MRRINFPSFACGLSTFVASCVGGSASGQLPADTQFVLETAKWKQAVVDPQDGLARAEAFGTMLGTPLTLEELAMRYFNKRRIKKWLTSEEGYVCTYSLLVMEFGWFSSCGLGVLAATDQRTP